MLVGIDSEVTITSMLFIPDPEVRGGYEYAIHLLY